VADAVTSPELSLGGGECMYFLPKITHRPICTCYDIKTTDHQQPKKKTLPPHPPPQQAIVAASHHPIDGETIEGLYCRLLPSDLLPSAG
jgi:hypothetical protein